MSGKGRKSNKSRKKDGRDWKKYNEELVVRGEFYLDFEFVKNWNEELEEMNRGKNGKHKRGGQYKFPDSFMKWLAIWKQWIDYRGLEGITRSFTKLGLIPEYSDFSSIWHRVHDMIPEISLPTAEELEVASDGTGLKTNNAGEYRVFRYGEEGRMKKHLIVVITADVKHRKLLKVDARVEGEGDSEPKIAEKHLKEVREEGKKVKKFYGDGAYDTNALFDYLEKENIESAIKIRSNASNHYCRGSKRRRREVREYQKLGYDQWASEKEYGMRWVATEGIFSAVKRKFGESVVSRNKSGLIAEAIQRFWSYDMLMEYGLNKVSEMT